jgi:hypothetical protein
MGELSKRHIRMLLRAFREAVGLGVALVCIGWVLFHLIGFFFYGYIMVGESNLPILFGEVAVTLSGLFCFLVTLYEDKLSSDR